MSTMSKALPARVSTPRSPITAVASPATHVTVFTVFERSGGLAGRAEGAVFLPSGIGLSICTVKNTLPVGRVKSACTRESHGQPSIAAMSKTEPFDDTELPCSRYVRRSRVRDGSGAGSLRLAVHDALPQAGAIRWLNRVTWAAGWTSEVQFSTL